MSQGHIKDIAVSRGVNLEKLPAHVGIIMDGNGRWANRRGLPRLMGHRKGADRAHEIFKAAAELGVNAITLYTFSQENWSRPPFEVRGLLRIFADYVTRYTAEIAEKGLRFRVIGDLTHFPDSLFRSLKNLEERTKNNSGTTLTLALGYGGRSEIVEACRSIAVDVASGHLKAADVSADLLGARMQTSGLPDLDLVIRTSGELRISNFLLWQIAYSELYFTEKYWPDFSVEDFVDAVADFQARDRRYGGVKGPVLVEKRAGAESGSVCSNSDY